MSYPVVYVKPGHEPTRSVDGREQAGKDFDEVNKVAIWDVDNAHSEVAPEVWGEYSESIIIAGSKKEPGKVYKVALTPGIESALASGRLIKVPKPKQE